MKNVLVIGSGGREAAIVKKLCEDTSIEHVFCAPGSMGIKSISSKVELFSGSSGYEALVAFVERQQVSLTIVGPEVPLVDGIVNMFNRAGLRIVGPTKAAAQIEGSKVFCKQLLSDNDIPTAPFEVFDDPGCARQCVDLHDMPVVIKADGLAAGKGVIVAHTKHEAMVAVNDIMVLHKFGKEAGQQVIVEDFLQGEECSIIALTDGETVIPFIPAQDYKPALDDDKGLNTGGMGCYAPVPAYTFWLREQIIKDILLPTVQAMQRAGTPYKGVLYAGIMLTSDGPQVLEFNCRFGDPETQALLALMKVDLLPLLEATANGTLGSISDHLLPRWHDEVAVCVVLAAPGYPGSYPKGLIIEGIDQAEAKGVSVIHAGTAQKPGGDGWITNGGRVLNLVALGATFSEARDCVYAGVECITFDGKKPHFRTDIAQRAC